MIEAAVLLFIFTVVVLSPPILAIVVLLQFRKTGGKPAWRVIVPVAVLTGWLLLVGWYVAWASKFLCHWLTTPLADVFLFLSLLLLLGSAVISVGRWKMCAATLLLLSLWVWTEQRQASLDDASSLSVLVSRMADFVGLPPGPNAFAVLHKMSSYQKRGHDDAAISLGKEWTEAHPRDGFNDTVFVAIAWSFLNKARHDTARADDYVDQALMYRNEALPVASDTTLPWSSVWTLRDLAIISRAAGDISPKRRCVQYGNALNLLKRRAGVIRDKQDEVSRRFVPVKDDPTAEDFKCLSDETQAAIDQLQKQQEKYACK